MCGLGSFPTWGTAAHRQFEWKQTGMIAVLRCESVFKTHTHIPLQLALVTHTHTRFMELSGDVQLAGT